MATVAKTLKVGGGKGKGVNVADGTGTSAVKILGMKNAGSKRVWIGEVGNGYPIEPGETAPGIDLIGQQGLNVVGEDDDEQEVHVLMSYSSID